MCECVLASDAASWRKGMSSGVPSIRKHHIRKPIIFSPSRGVESTAKTLPFLATALVTMKESYLCVRVYVCLIITRRRVCQFYAPASGRMEDSTTVPETWSVVFCFLPPTNRTGNEYGRAHALMAMICDSFRQCLNIWERKDEYCVVPEWMYQRIATILT